MMPAFIFLFKEPGIQPQKRTRSTTSPLTPQMRGQFNAETCFEQFHVSQILLLRHITVRVAKYLHFRRKAPNVETQDLATTRKTGGREYPNLAVAHVVHAVTCFVKDECVNVNLEPVAVGEHKSSILYHLP